MTPVPVKRPRRHHRRVVIFLVLLGGVVLQGQQIFRGFYGTSPPRPATPTTFKGAFNHCRLMFNSDRREKRGWDTDYPGAEINFSVRLAELTKARVTMDAVTGHPEYVTVRATEDALFQCPYVLVEDGGTAVFSEAEVEQLRAYLQKGGFIFASDYWGDVAKAQWDREIGRVLPPEIFPIVEIDLGHAIWRTHVRVTRIPQMPAIQYWRRSGGASSERGPGAIPSARGITDAHGRLMVVMLHNTDIPDGWEREGEESEYFFRFSPDAYAVGINVMLYAFTH